MVAHISSLSRLGMLIGEAGGIIRISDTRSSEQYMHILHRCTCKGGHQEES